MRSAPLGPGPGSCRPTKVLATLLSRYSNLAPAAAPLLSSTTAPFMFASEFGAADACPGLPKSHSLFALTHLAHGRPPRHRSFCLRHRKHACIALCSG